MSKKKKGKANWRGMAPYIGAREWLKALGIAALMALAALGAVYIAPMVEPKAEALPIAISRVMTSNPSACFSVDGAYYDWLELENLSDGAVNLEGWRLTKSGDLREAYVFGDIALAAGDRLVVYCDEAPADYAGEALFVGFRISADGEFLMLADPHQHIATLEVPQMAKTDVYQRAEDGSYAAIPFADALGLDLRLAGTLTPDYDPNGLMISEIMPVNRSVLPDEDGDYSDWIELYNATGAAIDLEGYALSDDDAIRLKWQFPARTMAPGEYLVVFASGKDRREAAGELHTSFRLSGEGEAVRLYTPQGDAISYVQYDVAPADKSLSREADGGMTASLDPSPGCENTDAGARQATVVLRSNPQQLYINEVYTSGSGCDWLELANASDAAVDLTGMGLSDDPAHPRKWQFPAGAQIPANGCLLVALVGDADAQAGAEPIVKAQGKEGRAPYTADFGLSEGETACLSTPEGALIDRVKLYDQHPNVSYGRAEGCATYRYFEAPTPGGANAGKSYAGVADEIQFSTPPGIVREKRISLEMTSSPGVDIFYTTDGSKPTRSSKRYTEPIPLDSNARIRAVAWKEDVIPSSEAVASFIFGQHTLRLVAVYGDRSQLIGSNGTLNTGVRKDGYNVYVEIYEPDGTQLIHQNCHLILSGHQSRTEYAQKSFRLTAKRNTGDTRFRAALFSNRDYDEYKAIVLRAAGQDMMQTKMRDSILTALAADTSVFYQETEPCVVYVNGKYWGLYNMRERVDEHSICQFEGWEDPDGVLLGEGTGESISAFRELTQWIRAHDLTSEANLQELRKRVDVENYLDYVALEMYTCNQDLNNVRFYCSPKEGPQWKWVLFDLDLSYQIDRNNVREWLAGGDVGSITAQDATLFRKLMKNDSVRDYFLTRMGQLLSTTLSAENVIGKIQARYKLIGPEMAANCKRWNWKTDTWNTYVKRMVSYAKDRPVKLAGYLKDAFHLSGTQAQAYFGDVIG